MHARKFVVTDGWVDGSKGGIDWVIRGLPGGLIGGWSGIGGWI